MNAKLVLDHFCSGRNFRSLLESVQTYANTNVQNATGSSNAFIVAGLFQNYGKSIVAILPDKESANYFKSDIENLIGDKLNNIVVQKGDFSRVDLPRPGYQISFKSTQMYDLRAPVSLSDMQLERPQITGDKAIVSCPKCLQKCRINVFKRMEITCPKCKQVWTQSA